jgi:hypothetical protein
MRLRVLVIVLVGLAGCSPKPTPEPHAERGHRPAESKTILGVTPPYSLVWCDDLYHAGVAGILIGSESDTLRFVLPSPLIPKRPRRMFSPSATEIEGRSAYLDSLKLGMLLPVRIGSLDGRLEGGRPLAIGSPGESLLIFAIKSSKRPPPSSPRHVHDHGASAWADWVTSYLEKRRASHVADTLTAGH